jgi:uncharacterized membrane protein YphA (DoxX/SURF4 family)
MATSVLVVTVLTAVLFLAAGSVKLAGAKQSLLERDHLGVSAPVWRAIGVLELAGVGGILVGLAVHVLAALAAAGLAALSVGAVASHIRRRDSVVHAAPAVAALVLSVALVVLQVQR